MNTLFCFLTAVIQENDYSLSQLFTDISFAILYIISIVIQVIILKLLIKIFKKLK